MKSIRPALLFLILFVAENIFAQTALKPRAFSVGVSAGEQGYDAGIGVEIGTPTVFSNRISFRIKGNISWLEHYKTAYDHWAKYRTVTGVLVYNAEVFERGRVYFELGTYFILPDQKFSTVKSTQGVTGSTGIELFLWKDSPLHISYYLSGGVGYIKAYADKLENEPRYGHGFIFNSGFRFYFLRPKRGI